MKLFSLIILVSAISSSSFAQVDSVQSSTPYIFFIELGGSSPVISLNLEKTNALLFSFRGGFGYLPESVFLNRAFLIPLSISKLIPLKSKANFFEIGISATLTYEIIDYKNENEFSILTMPLIGLRTQNLVGGGGFYRFSFHLINSFSGKNIIPWYGLSFGKSF